MNLINEYRANPERNIEMNRYDTGIPDKLFIVKTNLLKKVMSIKIQAICRGRFFPLPANRKG